LQTFCVDSSYPLWHYAFKNNSHWFNLGGKL